VSNAAPHWFLLLGLSVSLGAMVGSFLNVVVHRLPAGLSIVHPPSACPHCKRPIRPWHNVPVVSWIVLRGRCRDCSEPISARYPLVELATAALFGLLFVHVAGGPSQVTAPESLLVFLVYSAYFSALLAIGLVDADHFIVPDVISLPLVPLGITAAALLETSGLAPLAGVTLPGAVLGAVAGAGVMVALAAFGRLLFGREALGMGDVKLVAAIGAWQGAHPALLLTVFLGSLLGSVVGIGSMVVRGRERYAKLPFGPYLCAGALVAWLWGDIILAQVATRVL